MKQTKCRTMKTLRLLGMIGLTAVLALSFTACSSDDEPALEPDEDIVIETPLPADAEAYTVYAIRHEKKAIGSECTFIFNFGDNPLGLELKHVQVISKNGNVLMQKTLYSPLYKEYVPRDDPEWNRESCCDCFTMPCYNCEMIEYFKFTLDYDGDGWEEVFTQPWKSPHDFF